MSIEQLEEYVDAGIKYLNENYSKLTKELDSWVSKINLDTLDIGTRCICSQLWLFNCKRVTDMDCFDSCPSLRRDIKLGFDVYPSEYKEFGHKRVTELWKAKITAIRGT
jgi:hypothetical protein